MAGNRYAPSPLAKEALIALGRQLATLRNKAGYSQWEFAPLTGFSRSTLSDAELGRHWQSRDFWISADTALKRDGQLLAAFDQIAHLRADKRFRFPASSHVAAVPNKPANAHVVSVTLAWSDGTVTVLRPGKDLPVMPLEQHARVRTVLAEASAQADEIAQARTHPAEVTAFHGQPGLPAGPGRQRVAAFAATLPAPDHPPDSPAATGDQARPGAPGQGAA